MINIGYGRAAAALCDLTGERITLEVPKVDVYFIEELRSALLEVFKGEVWSVHQVFSGLLNGHALLLADEKAAHTLTKLILRGESYEGKERAAAEEVLSEVGNIVLHGALGTCGDLLEMQVSFSVPGLRVEKVAELLNTVTVRSEGLQYALVIRTRFQILKREVSGYLVLVFGVTSFTRMMEAIEEWERRGVAKRVQK